MITNSKVHFPANLTTLKNSALISLVKVLYKYIFISRIKKWASCGSQTKTKSEI